MRYLLLFVIFIGFNGCKTKQQVRGTNNSLEIATRKLGVKIDSFPNSSGQFILYVQKEDTQHPTRMLSAVVIEVKTEKIVAEESFIPGYIKWIDASTLEMLNAPGMIKAGEDLSSYTRKINLSSIKNN
jgi:hypothetical protein